MNKSILSLILGSVLALGASSVLAQAPAAVTETPAGQTQVVVPGMATVPALLVQQLPSWFEGNRPHKDAGIAITTLLNAQAQGLNPQDYQALELASAFEQAHQLGVPADAITQLDTRLTTALKRYLTDLNQGRLSPEVLKHRFRAPELRQFDAHDYLAEARRSGRFAQALNEAEPKVPMYASIRSAMNAYRVMGDHIAWQTALPSLPNRSLKPGQPYSGLEIVAARLKALGDLADTFVGGEAYEGELVDAVSRFQARHGLEVDGVMGPATLQQLNVTPAQRVEQMALTLERLRWTPLLYAPRMIVVNVPEFVLRAYEQHDGRVRLDHEMKVIVGRALDTRTPIFLEDMRFIEFSPYWNVPRSIARGETLPRLRRDPAYFTRQGFEFVTGDGKVVNSLSEEAIGAVQRGEWRIRQRPGPRNAMGTVKFIFPNDQNIYLHYTANPELFSRARRDFSHGCIRIESPEALAQFVLKNQPEWTPERIHEAMESGRSSTLRLKQTIPVLIAYSTVVVKDNGKVYFFPDIYQQDQSLKQALLSARGAQ